MSDKTPAVPVHLIDYYIENGKYVFTAAYHRKRGYCCGSGCRHCPYPPEVQEAEMKKNNKED